MYQSSENEAPFAKIFQKEEEFNGSVGREKGQSLDIVTDAKIMITHSAGSIQSSLTT